MTLYKNLYDPPGNCIGVLWYRLIRDVEQFNSVSGLGMANVWHLIHMDDYDGARKLFDRIVSDWQPYVRARM